jgi:hypothetical protein
MPLTGRYRFRKSLMGKLVLQFEHDEPPFWLFSMNGGRRRRWRDAQLDDLVLSEVRGLLEFEDYVAQVPEANHSPRIGPLARRRLPHEALHLSAGAERDRGVGARPSQHAA